MTKIILTILLGGVGMALASGAQAGVIATYSGQDDGVYPGPWPVSSGVASAFLAAAAGFGPVYTETFESVPVGTGSQGSPTFSIPGATVTSNTSYGPNDGFGGVNSTTYGQLYGFNVTPGGSNWYGFINSNGPTGTATFTFTHPTNSFGFYTTGVQTIFTATLDVTFNDGVSETLNLPINVNGGVSYFGLTDTTAFSSISINDTSTGGGTDAWGIDNVSYNYSAVPEPSTWAMMGLGFMGLGLVGFLARRGAISIA